MTTQQFNATNELTKLRQHKAACRKQRYRHSRLQKYRTELVQLHKAGASSRELALWLKQEKRLRMAHTTIMRYLKNLTELKPTPNEVNNAQLSQT